MRSSSLRRRLSAALLTTALVASVLTGGPAAAFTPTPHGVPARPAAPATPDPALTAHALAYADGALDNPLKGFARYYFPGDNENSGYPHSLQWSYFGLSEVMTDAANCNSYNWTVLDNALNEIASYGNQAAIRFYLEYPGGSGTHPGNAIPHCFDGHVTYRNNTYWGTVSPDYDSAYLLTALGNFIAAFGARYDGDPRIGFIHLGLIGLWGEWHTWPFDTDTTGDSYPNLMPTDAHAAQIITDYDNAFNKTKLEVRYPDSGGGGANNLDVGYHDDSFCYKEGSPLAGVTLPQSLGGANYAQLQRALNVGVENKWTTDSMGGEVRPEIQSSAFSFWPGGSGQVDNMKACIELEHTTWKINQTSQSYAATDANVAAAVRLMGYNLSVSNAYFKNSATGTTNVGVQIKNDGVAPFYYPWTVTLGVKDSTGAVVRSWDTSWDLRTVQPLKIRAFPDWGVGSDPTYLDYGYPQYFQSAVDLSGLASGAYSLVLRVKNPLETVSASAKKFRFANATQGSDGWVGLGSMSVGSGGGGDTAAPSVPGGLASPSQTSASISLTWNASTDNTGVTGYRVLRNGTQIATTTTTGYTDVGLAAGTSYTYTVAAYDAAGNVSAASSPLTVSTQTAGGGGSPASYEAEASGNTLAGGAAVSACGPCSGGSKVGYLGNGGTLTFTGVAGGSGGSTPVTVYYASAEARSATLSVNGGTPTTVNFAASGGWTTVVSATVNLALAAGNNTITVANASGWAPDVDRITVGTGGAGDTAAPSVPTGLTSPNQTTTTIGLSWTASTDNVGVASYRVYRGTTLAGTATTTSFTDTGLTAGTQYSYTVRAVDAAGNVSAASSALNVSTSSGTTPPPTGLVVDDFDGVPTYPSTALNDLGRWTGGNCFLNGGGSGVESGGALALQYNNCGWFGSDVATDVSGYTYLVVRIKGAAGGEQTHFTLGLGGVTLPFNQFTLSGGGHPVITTAYQDVKIPMVANGMSRTSPGQLALAFWYGGASTVSIDSISFTN
ncbi:fibronectin type III domain-containing protein [Hamadaea tsunoensis]|uniref:fibronectin type III domain-containing protein n=1 Tax=Hamadaea tsunoensis TaxID=53368 RepID=UPI0004187617|nr:fibronectin type III domain-containing protein [Hamadaea tsunoensis]